MSKGTPFFQIRIFHESVDAPALVVFWQILGYREPFLVDEQETMAIFVNLHVVAGAYPGAVGGFFLLVGVETARAQRPTNSAI